MRKTSGNNYVLFIAIIVTLFLKVHSKTSPRVMMPTSKYIGVGTIRIDTTANSWKTYPGYTYIYNFVHTQNDFGIHPHSINKIKFPLAEFLMISLYLDILFRYNKMKCLTLFILSVLTEYTVVAEILNLDFTNNCTLQGGCDEAKNLHASDGFGEHLRNTQQQIYYGPSLINNNYLWRDEMRKLQSDGTYIYFHEQNKLQILKAYSTDIGPPVSTIDFDFQIGILKVLVYKDNLAVLGGNFDWDTQIWKTTVLIYNIHDRSKPQLKNNFTICGKYTFSLVLENGLLYLINGLFHEDQNWYDIGNGSVSISESEVDWYHQLKQNRSEVINIIAFDINNPQNSILARSFKLKNITIYASGQNVYFAKSNQELGQTIIIKVLVKRNHIRPIAFNTIDGVITVDSSLNQLQGYLRAVVDNQNSRDLFILGPHLQIYGNLANISNNQRQYSCLYSRKRLYLVTYKRINLFYAIDLSNPYRPKLIGQLKLPSLYYLLLSIDQNLLIGLEESLSNSSEKLTTKVTILNITNPLNLIQAASYISQQYPSSWENRNLSSTNILLAPQQNILAIDFSPVSSIGALIFYASPSTITLKSIIQHKKGSRAFNTQFLIVQGSLYIKSSCKISVAELKNYESVKTVDLC